MGSNEVAQAANAAGPPLSPAATPHPYSGRRRSAVSAEELAWDTPSSAPPSVPVQSPPPHAVNSQPPSDAPSPASHRSAPSDVHPRPEPAPLSPGPTPAPSAASPTPANATDARASSGPPPPGQVIDGGIPGEGSGPPPPPVSAPEASPSAPTAASERSTGKGLPNRGLRSKIARPPRRKTAESAGEVTLDEDTARVPVKRLGKVRSETETEVQSPTALKKPPGAEQGLRARAKTVTRSHAVHQPVASPPPVAQELADKTAAMPSIPDADSREPFDADAGVRAASSAALRNAGIEPRPYRADATAEALHEEDEDGPTMVAPIPSEALAKMEGRPPRPGPPPTDEEATQVHPGRLAPQPVTQPPPQNFVSAPISVPPPPRLPVRSTMKLANAEGFPIPGTQPAAIPNAAHPPSAMDLVMSMEAKRIEAQKGAAFDTFAACIMGVGMITSALAAYLASRSIEKTAGYFGVVALTSVAMFLVGLGTLQKRNETKVIFVALGGVMLVFTLGRLLLVAI